MSMKRTHSLFYHIMVFVLAQLAWFSLLGLWIYWYVKNYIIFTNVGDKLSPQIVAGGTNAFTLVSGLILLVLVSVGMSMIFIYLNRQLSLTRLYDNFISNVTHELKSPLSSIQLYLETMQSRDVPRAKQEQFFTLMLKDVQRLNHLINSILYMSGLEREKTARKYLNDYQLYDAGTIVTELVVEAAEQLQIPSESLEIKGTAPCRCVIDRRWMRIVFDNLFDNAVKYSPETLRLQISLSCDKKFLTVEVTDQGIGITPKDQKKIFQKFQRIYAAGNPNVKGTGLGLYWVKQIIKYHGGKISVFSRGLGQGTTFKIELPVYGSTKKRYLNKILKSNLKGTE